MSEYSTMEHIYRIHGNHSEQFAINSDDHEDGNDQPTYQHVEHMKTGVSLIPFTLMNETDVSCSPKFTLSKFHSPSNDENPLHCYSPQVHD